MTKLPVEILLVEDNSTDAELTMHALQRHGLSNTIQWVKDGAEALDYLYGRGEYAEPRGVEQPHLILLDLKMPRVSGLEVLARIKGDEALSTIPVVVLTSSDNERDILECYRLGVNSYVSKPVEFQAFSDAVRELGFYWLLVNRVP